MKLPRWLISLVALLTFLLVLDTAGWLVATRALRAAVEDWARQEREAGTKVALGDMAAGGWPLAASLRYEVRLGPQGLPAGLTAQAGLTSRLSLAHPRLIETDLTRARLTAPGGADVVATASTWTVDVAWARPDHAWMQATDWHLVGSGTDILVGSLHGEETRAGPTSLRATLQARDIDVGPRHPGARPALGGPIRSVDLKAVLSGGLPVAAATAEVSARAWREAGGAVELERLAVAVGPLDALVSGRLGLDVALRPVGSFVVTAHGLAPFVEALGSSGVIPPHTGQAVGGVLALLGGAVELPVTIADGRIMVAGFPLARLPRVAWEPQESH